MAKQVNYFLPYMRQGIMTLADHKQGGQRPSLPVKVNVRAYTKKDKKEHGTATVDQEVMLFGPGDVLGIDKRAITRIAPSSFANNFEDSLVPFIEFSMPDLLWRFSSKKTGDNWIPWLTLIVLKSDGGKEEAEFEKIKNPNKELPPQIQLKPHAVLPDLKQSWRWAHVHLLALENSANAQILETLKSAPEKAVCRLMCARRLKPLTKYHAFLIPSFRIGADAALGIKNGEKNRNVLTWETVKEGAGQILPYYFDWEFSTGSAGDFELLVEKLKPRELTNLGTRTIDCSNPGYGLDEKNGLELEMEAALRSADTSYQKWGMDEDNPPNKKQKALASLLNKREEVIDGVKKLRVTPPVYGEWYVRRGNENIELDAAKTGEWLEELNLDFRHRAAAGLGVQFVKDNQENLMQAAWTQLNKIREVNRELNLGRFGRAVSNRMYGRMEKMGGAQFLNTILPLQYKIEMGTTKTTSRSLSGNVKRSLGSLLSQNKVAKNQTKVKVKKYISRRKVKVKSSSASETAISSFQAIAGYNVVNAVFQPHGMTSTPPLTTIKVEQPPMNFVETGNEIKQALRPAKTIEAKFINRYKRFRDIEKRSDEPSKGNQRARSIATIPQDDLRPIIWYPEFHQAVYRFLRDQSQEYILPGLENIPANTIGLLFANTRFIEAFMMGMNHEFASELRWREFPTDMRGNYFRSFWDTTIYSMDEKEQKEFHASPLASTLTEKIKRKFKSYDTIEKIAASYTNGEPSLEEQEIASAYEAAVEKWLLIREEDKDIQEPSKWERTSSLGSHPNPKQSKFLKKKKAKKEEDPQLVILIKGELLQKFGNTLIYLVKKDALGKPILDTASARIFPVFEGALPPDMTFIGFPTYKSKAADYFLIFEERMTDLRFGLDIKAEETATPDVNDFSWEHFNIKEGDYLNGKAPSILPEQWKNAASIGKVMVQKQVRVAVELEAIIPD